MDRLNISIIESVYLVYMFHFFKTSMDFNILSSPKGSESFIITTLLKRSKVKIIITKSKLKMSFFNIK